ncbi:SAM-dependent methyltransferase [Sphaerisporangium sp. NPDC049002]|uniref:SAM-dependent methyltransferase n=1 Tax=unclassified Sphaerisporangium TaxID=2630420 RepID=UPI0033F44A2C
MTPNPGESPLSGFDATTPNVGRMYDYYLGGKDNYASDREAAEKVIGIFPRTRELARANRDFLRRAVEYLAREKGIRQFLDIGSGLPTQENVHQVAQRANPAARVAYVDLEPIVLAHGQALLATDDQTIMVTGDLREPDKIIGHQDVRAHLDLAEPTAVLLVFVMHFIKDSEDPLGIVKTLVDALAPGSCLVLSHAELDDRLTAGTSVYDRATSPAVLRSRDEIEAFFDGLALVEPGVARLGAWRPDGPLPRRADTLPAYCGVGRKK